MEGAVGKEEQETLIETFVGIASSTREEAVFFLESHNWQLDSSIHSFFEHQQPIIADQQQPLQEQEEEEEEEIVPLPRVRQPPTVDPPAMASREEGRNTRKKKAASGASGSRPKIRTLSDLKSGPGSDSDSDGPQEYYTGGEKSGMLVQDPQRGGHDVDSIFDQARQMGALQGPFEHQPSSSSRTFTGTGRLLSGETVSAAPQQPENVVHNICFWSNGFTVNDGPLRRFDDPENALFLESIKKSECPKELEPEDRRTSVHVNLIRREENCPELVKQRTPFQGVGRTLGGGGSSTGSSGPESPAPAAAAALTTTTSSAPGPLVIDDSLPTTSIQIRFSDGTRTVARFNTRHTVGDIRAFINNHTSSRHGVAATAYTLQTVGFPPKQLTDVTQSIEQAGLANSVVIQKL
ncbi:plant UBX domain-containing protein 4-like [Iris pallida]|uniref:Plant UBX domain-containing protein 4-like n=1 Tax=Iris pallida TaxID=29817 RepID=A0AAX6EJM7_IRIPA|nr:plant UBX domain-containing protein 4-like [Iris pallida]